MEISGGDVRTGDHGIRRPSAGRSRRRCQSGQARSRAVRRTPCAGRRQIGAILDDMIAAVSRRGLDGGASGKPCSPASFGPARTNSPTGPMCRRAWSSANMSISPMPSMATRRRVDQRRYSIVWPGSYARTNWQSPVAPAKPLDEFALIARYFRPLAGGGKGRSISPTMRLSWMCGRPSPWSVTADALVAGVHFFAEDAPDLIARKMLRVNLSDLAAMAAVPLGYVMTCAFPRISARLARRIRRRSRPDQVEFGITLLGGDTTATPGPLTFSVNRLRQRRDRARVTAGRRQGRRPDRGKRHHRRRALGCPPKGQDRADLSAMRN